jgi:hypothetical protein
MQKTRIGKLLEDMYADEKKLIDLKSKKDDLQKRYTDAKESGSADADRLKSELDSLEVDIKQLQDSLSADKEKQNENRK